MINMIHWPIYTGPVKSISNANVFKVLEQIGNPQEKLKNIFHVGGTNGKGTICNYIYNAMVKEGYKVGLYTSPHMVYFNERIVVNGKMISDEEIFSLTEKVRHICEKDGITLTMFEVTTIVAIEYFASQGCDACVIEVGMGGLNDATNVFDASNLAACVFGNVSYDHEKFLGQTLHEISLIKCGIIKKGVPVVISDQYEESLNAMKLFCKHFECNPFFYGEDFEVARGQKGLVFRYGEDKIQLPMTDLKADYQIVNLSVAVFALLYSGLIEDFASIQHSIENTKVNGRLEVINKSGVKSLIGEGDVVYFDCAHNPSGASELAAFISDSFDDMEYNLNIIIGKTQDSDLVNFVTQFDECYNSFETVFWAVNSFSEPLYMSAESMSRIINKGYECIPEPKIEDAIHRASIHFDNGKKNLIVICGSMYLYKLIQDIS